jgi:hypothetical protein
LTAGKRQSRAGSHPSRVAKYAAMKHPAPTMPQAIYGSNLIVTNLADVAAAPP